MNARNIIITGGRRVGTDLARRLAVRHQANIVMTWHTSRAEIEKTVAELSQQYGITALAIQADLSDPDAAQRVVRITTDELGRVDALVNMASIFPRTQFQTLTPKDFERNLAANLAGPYHIAVAAGQQMLKQPDDEHGYRGRMIHIGDWAIDRPYRDYLPYLVAKGGLKTMTLALANELAPHVAVNMIQPAMIDPPPDMTPDDIRDVVGQTPLRRVGSPADVNELILYLLYSTNFVTGTCIRVDGGRFLGEGHDAND
ncbi:MAG: SDR family NAD(P)-dependent oxidoreductase [bacterium]